MFYQWTLMCDCLSWVRFNNPVYCIRVYGNIIKCCLSSQGSVTLPKLWLLTLPSHTLSSKHGPSSTCSHLLVLRFRGPAARILGTQVHDIRHTARATCTFNSGERGCNSFSPGPTVEGLIGNLDSGWIGSWLSAFIRCFCSLDVRVLWAAGCFVWQCFCVLHIPTCDRQSRGWSQWGVVIYVYEYYWWLL